MPERLKENHLITYHFTLIASNCPSVPQKAEHTEITFYSIENWIFLQQEQVTNMCPLPISHSKWRIPQSTFFNASIWKKDLIIVK